MKKEELTAFGLSEELANKVLALVEKDAEKQDKTISALTAERDDFKNRLQTAETTLKKFDGIDPQKIQEEIQSYKTAAENAEKNFNKQITQRDQKDWINGKLDEYGVSSPYARRQLTSDLMSEESGLKWKDGGFFGFDDFMKSAKEKDNSLYLTAEEKAEAEKAAALKEKSPAFTGPTGDKAAPGSEKFTPPKIF